MTSKDKTWKTIGFAYTDRRPKQEKIKYYLYDQELWDVCQYIRNLENELSWLKTNPEYAQKASGLSDGR